LLTDDVINAGEQQGAQYGAEARADLSKSLAPLRLVLPKTSAPGKTELLRKLERVKRPRLSG
jgi:hypothetical protein